MGQREGQRERKGMGIMIVVLQNWMYRGRPHCGLAQH
jgi:hypothetical protein